MLSPQDHLDLRRLTDLYGHLIDERLFSRIGEVFTADVVYDVSDFGRGVQHGIAEVVDGWRQSTEHPLAHVAANVIVDERPDGTVEMITKGLGIGASGRVGSVTYYDVAARTDAGWRIAVRRAVLRRPETIPDES
jgi:hypothetical protein